MAHPNPRRIVTGLHEDGTSYIARVDELEPSFHPRGETEAEREMLRVAYPRWAEGEVPDVRVVWGAAELPFRLPNDPTETPSGALGGELGLRASVTIYPPGWEGEFFWANRVNLMFIMRGALTYTTDNGDRVVAEAGDVIIQNGTNNQFRNEGSEDVWMGACMFTARRTAGPTPPPDRFQGANAERDQVLAIAKGESA